MNSIRKAFVIIWLAGVVLWALLDNGLTSVLSVGLLLLVLYVSVRLGGWNTSRRNTECDTPHFGPTNKEIDLDPMFKMFSHNVHHHSD